MAQEEPAKIIVTQDNKVIYSENKEPKVSDSYIITAEEFMLDEPKPRKSQK